MSVVIVVFRDRDEVERIVDSIIPFKTEDLEIVVIDGKAVHAGVPSHGCDPRLPCAVKMAKNPWVVSALVGPSL